MNSETHSTPQGQPDITFHSYPDRRQRLLDLLRWTPYGPKDVAEEIGSERSQVSAVLHGHKTSAPMLDEIEQFLREIEEDRPEPLT